MTERPAVEVTEAMIEAGIKTAWEDSGILMDAEDARAIYLAMHKKQGVGEDVVEEISRLQAENARLQLKVTAFRAKSKAAGRDLLREEADALLPHFSTAWEMLRDIASRAGAQSAAWAASRARDLQSRGLVESKWCGADRTSSFKVWRLAGRPVPITRSGQIPIAALTVGDR